MLADGEGTSDGIHFTDVALGTYCDAMIEVLEEIQNSTNLPNGQELNVMTFNLHAGSDATIE